MADSQQQAPAAIADSQQQAPAAIADSQQQALAPIAPAPIAPAQGSGKRPRSDQGEIPGGSEYVGSYTQEGRVGQRRNVLDIATLSERYDRFLRERQLQSYAVGGSHGPVSAGMGGQPVEVMRMTGVGGMDGGSVGYGSGVTGVGGMDGGSVGYGSGVTGVGGMDGGSVGYGSGRQETPLPPVALCTLFVEGLPADCTHREVSHIFRPFAGFQEIRLVNRESRYPGADPLILCFVDFSNPSQAAVALNALQGYKFDERDRDSANLRLQFARFSGPRSAGRPRGGR